MFKVKNVKNTSKAFPFDCWVNNGKVFILDSSISKTESGKTVINGRPVGVQDIRYFEVNYLPSTGGIFEHMIPPAHHAHGILQPSNTGIFVLYSDDMCI